jgi:hypothetical protein
MRCALSCSASSKLLLQLFALDIRDHAIADMRLAAADLLDDRTDQLAKSRFLLFVLLDQYNR